MRRRVPTCRRRGDGGDEVEADGVRRLDDLDDAGRQPARVDLRCVGPGFRFGLALLLRGTRRCPCLVDPGCAAFGEGLEAELGLGARRIEFGPIEVEPLVVERVGELVGERGPGVGVELGAPDDERLGLRVVEADDADTEALAHLANQVGIGGQQAQRLEGDLGLADIADLGIEVAEQRLVERGVIAQVDVDGIEEGMAAGGFDEPSDLCDPCIEGDVTGRADGCHQRVRRRILSLRGLRCRGLRRGSGIAVVAPDHAPPDRRAAADDDEEPNGHPERQRGAPGSRCGSGVVADGRRGLRRNGHVRASRPVPSRARQRTDVGTKRWTRAFPISPTGAQPLPWTGRWLHDRCTPATWRSQPSPSSKSGHRARSSSKATRPSRRASGAPRQKCTP